MSTSISTRPRCYGYTPAGDLIPHEATVIRGVVASVLGGHLTLYQAALELNDAGITTATGRPWQLTSLVRLLTNPRLAGLAHKSRADHTPAEPVITVAQHEQLAAAAAARKTGPGRFPWRDVRPLLGLVVCAKDGQVMTGHINAAGQSYRCPAGDTQIQAGPLEQFVYERTAALSGPAAWATAQTRRASIAAVWEKVEIGPPTRHTGTGLDTARVHLVGHDSCVAS